MRAVILALIVGACASNPPINSFCAWFIPGDPTDKGVFGLNSANKISFLANQNTYDRERCEAQKLGDRSKSGGPR